MQDSQRFFRYCSLWEGLTLLLLLTVAVPLKHLGGQPGMVSWLGPLHGLAFLAYQYSLLQLDGLPRRQLWRGVVSAFLPGGTWLFVRSLRDVSLG
jgi:integral membrane protein